MKIKLLNLLIFSIFSISQAQTTRNVGDFNKVTVFDKIEVVLVKSSENKVVLEGNNTSSVELVNKNGELKIRMNIENTMQGENISATVYYKKIDAIEANEGSKIETSETIKATIFNIIAKEGGRIKINLNAQKLNVKGNSGAVIECNGNAQNQEAILTAGAQYDSENLETQQTTVTVNAGGNADIYATELVEAKVRAGGEITIYGHPKQINQKNIAGGTIKEAK